jgi:outer membrane biosynthesis protein TonB
MERTKTMKLSKVKAIALFEAMGYQTASKWDKDKMEKKLLKLAEMAADSPDLGTDEMNDLLDELLACESVITIVDDEPEDITEVHDETEAEVEAEKKSKKKDKKKKGKKGKKGKKAEPEATPEPEPKVEKKAEKKAKKEKEKAPTRVGLCAKYVMSCSSPTPVEEIKKNADALFVASGGTSNDKEAGYAWRMVRQVLEPAGLLSVENDTVTITK